MIARPRVLLADDYPAIATAIERLLSIDCEVVGVVADGRALIESATRLRPDVIVIDLNMPNVHGLDACRQITQADPRVKVIVLTGVADADIRQHAFAAGACAYIAKHALVGELLPAVKNAVSG